MYILIECIYPLPYDKKQLDSTGEIHTSLHTNARNLKIEKVRIMMNFRLIVIRARSLNFVT